MCQSHRIHGAAIYGNMDHINIPQMLAYIPYMDPMGMCYNLYTQRSPVGLPRSEVICTCVIDN